MGGMNWLEAEIRQAYIGGGGCSFRPILRTRRTGRTPPDPVSGGETDKGNSRAGGGKGRCNPSAMPQGNARHDVDRTDPFR
ncbi:hypothetical protein mvi_57370 [Methylobacterium indicum]|uniref:Uncharacterized protein n=1 Tax=Methylobacterium indicum TaxID=1775910 RepID=A0A8H9C9P3_9HYPH|nr:hypothetical protein mvi_57370 [Methylobacterium indicum]